METNYSDMVMRYKMAHSIVWGKLSVSQQSTINSDRILNTSSLTSSEFIKSVTKMAEDRSIILKESIPTLKPQKQKIKVN